MSRLFAAAVCALIAVSACVLAAEAAPVTYTGTVVDAQGKPVAGATIDVYERALSGETVGVRALGKTTTDAAGTFSVAVAPVGDAAKLGREAMPVILAAKEGLSLGWASTMPGQKPEVAITLEAPTVLGGSIVDESGAPVAGAEVGAILIRKSEREMEAIVGMSPVDALIAKTGGDGRFSFNAVPPGVTAEFLVSASGRVSLFTLNPQRGTDQGQFVPGQADIKITLPKEALIEGMIVDKETGKPVSGIKVKALVDHPLLNPFDQPKDVSGPDGTFRLNRLAGAGYTIQLEKPVDGIGDWVAAPFKTTTESGKTETDVKIDLEKGGILEVTVTDAATKAPVPEAYVNAILAGESVSLGQTNGDGVARARLLPGTYRGLSAWKQGYNAPQTQAGVTVATGATEHASIELQGIPQITGTVLDGAGKPVVGASVKAVQGGWGPPTYSGDGGKFLIPFQRFPGSSETTYLVVSYPAENLAAVEPVEDFEKPVEVTVLPCRGIKGRVFAPDGKPIPNAKVAVFLWPRNPGSSISGWGLSTDSSGSYEVEALADWQRYSVDITADGYGRKSIRINMADAIDTVVAVEDAVLPVADKSVSGTVVDVDGKGVADAEVYAYGQNQNPFSVRTDKDGKFKLDKLAEGQVDINANLSGWNTYGQARAYAGDRDVTVIMREQRAGQAAEPKKAQPLLGKPLPDLKALDARPEWAAAVEKASATPILIVFFDSTQRPSRSAVTRLSQQAKDLAAKGVAVFCVDVSSTGAESSADWAAKANVPFAVAALAKPQETQFAWGVEALPWLILADKGGAVRAEGFTLEELDAKIAEAAVK